MSVKKILVAAALAGLSTTSAFAADLPARIYTKAPPIAVAYDWSGFYLGVNAGLGLGRSPTSLATPRTLESASAIVGREGAIGGGQLGYNLQFGTWVLGVETDIQAASMRDNRFCGDECTPITGRAYTVDQRLNWFGTTRGRIGLATGPVLSYVTGGFAYGGVNTDVATVLGPNLSSGSFNQTRTGYTYGSGVEASLGGNWTGKLEYLYLNLGTQSGGFGTGPFPGIFNSEIREHIFRAGLNYRIGGNAAYAAAPVANWSGFYIGGNAGGALARNSTATNGINNVGNPFATETSELMPNGFLGGVQAGYNWQAANWVFGLETDIQGSTQKDNENCMLTCATGGTFLMVDQRMSWLGTVRGRLGYSLGSTLFYGTAGLAYGGIENRLSGSVSLPVATSFNHTRTGWTAGGGIETPFELFGLFGRNWTSKTEYLYVDLGNISDTDSTFNIITISSHVHEHIFRSGLNYHFNAPVVARY
jgi:outer membrane immunogenic protein